MEETKTVVVKVETSECAKEIFGSDFERKVNIVLNLWRVNPYWTMACKRIERKYPNDTWEWRIVVDKVEGDKFQPSHRYIVFTVQHEWALGDEVEWLFDGKQSEEEGMCCFYNFDLVRKYQEEGILDPEKWKLEDGRIQKEYL